MRTQIAAKADAYKRHIREQEEREQAAKVSARGVHVRLKSPELAQLSALIRHFNEIGPRTFQSAVVRKALARLYEAELGEAGAGR